MENIIVLDVECLRSPEDCRHCYGQERMHHDHNRACFRNGMETKFAQISWDNKAALGLSIGGAFAYWDDRIHWFDEHNLEDTVSDLVERQPLMVSFNGKSFDFELICSLLEQRADAIERAGTAGNDEDFKLHVLCDDFEKLAARSYDILAEIWRADPDRKFERGLNSLDAIAQANGLGPKLSHGAQAARDWQAGRHADVNNYNQDDILKTKALFEMINLGKGRLKRGDGEWLQIRWIEKDTGKWWDPVNAYKG